LPERGIWNIHGLITSLGFVVVGFLCYSAPSWLPGLGIETVGYMSLHPVDGHVLPLAVTAVIAAVMLLAVVILCLRNTDAEAALLACLVALYLALALLHLEFISVAMCTAAGLCLVYGLLRSSYAMAYRDDLTGLFGRRALNERLKSLGRTYSIAMLDVDHFKKFNDKHGHEVGDQVLRLVSSRIKQVSGGTAYRYGGEEFSIIFPRKSVEECVENLDALRKSIADYEMSLRDSDLRPKKKKQGSQKRGATRIGGGLVSVTISIGVAERSEEFADAGSVIRLADENLYKAKRAGRNRVVG
jgi:GGDEF domain-containing protein